MPTRPQNATLEHVLPPKPAPASLRGPAGWCLVLRSCAAAAARRPWPCFRSSRTTAIGAAGWLAAASAVTRKAAGRKTVSSALTVTTHACMHACQRACTLHTPSCLRMAPYGSLQADSARSHSAGSRNRRASTSGGCYVLSPLPRTHLQVEDDHEGQ